MAEEIGRLSQGYQCLANEHTMKGTDTCKCTTKQQLPPGTKPTYVQVVTACREQKAGPYQVRMTVGGNLINYMGNVATKTANHTTVKILLNKPSPTQASKQQP